MRQAPVTQLRPGATPAEWAAFAALCRSDLLPVVCAGPPSERLGVPPLKVPSRLTADGKTVGFKAWADHRATQDEIDLWSRTPEYGISVICRTVRAIDVDIEDPVVVTEILDLLDTALGPVPIRTRPNSNRLLALVKVPGRVGKRIMKSMHGAVEILGDRQQFVAAGTHKSGARYEWPRGLHFTPPEITAEELDAMCKAIAAVIEAEGIVETIPKDLVRRHASQIEDPAVPWILDHWEVHEVAKDGRLFVKCPWEHEHTVDSGMTATAYFPAGLGGRIAPGFKCLHAHCEGRTAEEFYQAIGYVKALFTDTPQPKEGDKIIGPRDKLGRAEGSVHNISVVLRAHGIKLRHDDFMQRLYIGEREYEDADTSRLIKLLEPALRLPSAERFRMARDIIAEHYDSAIDWLTSQKWDGVQRVDTFWLSYAKCDADERYLRVLSRYLFTAAAARVLDPGHDVHIVPVLVGPQGIGKSRLTRALAPLKDSHVELDLSHRDDELARQLRGKLIAELGELRGLRKRQREELKAWITRSHDEWRPLYRETTVRVPRRVVFIATTNANRFLDDPTGNRRWAPLRVSAIDVEAVSRDVVQLWAEGAELFRQHGVPFAELEQLARPYTAEHAAPDPVLSALREWARSTPPGRYPLHFVISSTVGTRARVEPDLVAMAVQEVGGKLVGDTVDIP